MTKVNPSDMASIGSLEVIPTFDLPTITSEDFSKKYDLLVHSIKQLTELKKKVDEKIKEEMEGIYNKTGDATLISGDRKYTYIPPSSRITIDSEKLKQERPDVYTEYARISQVSATLRSSTVKPKEEEEE